MHVMDAVNPYIVRFPTSEFQTTDPEGLNKNDPNTKKEMSETIPYNDKVNVFNDNPNVQMVIKHGTNSFGDLRIKKGRLYVQRFVKSIDFSTHPRRDTVKEFKDFVAIVVEVPYPSGDKTDFVFIPEVNGETEKNKNLYSVTITMHGNQLELKPRKYEIDSLLELNSREHETESIILKKSTNFLSVKEVVMRSNTIVTLTGDINCQVEIENSDLKMFNHWLRQNKNVNLEFELENQCYFNFGTLENKNYSELRNWLIKNWNGCSIEKNAKKRYNDIQEENLMNRSKEEKIEEKTIEKIKKNKAWGWWSVRSLLGKTNECFNFEMVDDVRPWNGS